MQEKQLSDVVLKLSKGRGGEKLKFYAKSEETEYDDKTWASSKIILVTLGKMDNNKEDQIGKVGEDVVKMTQAGNCNGHSLF